MFFLLKASSSWVVKEVPLMFDFFKLLPLQGAWLIAGLPRAIALG